MRERLDARRPAPRPVRDRPATGRRRHRTPGVPAIVAALLLVAGCGGTPDRSGETGGVTPTDGADPSTTATPPGDGASTGDDPTATESAVSQLDAGSVPPDVVAAVVEDAVARTGVPEAAIRVVRAEQVTYRDGSLGCPQPGRQYTQALVDGHWLVLDADGTTLDYRIGGSGGFRLCPDGGSEPLPRDDT